MMKGKRGQVAIYLVWFIAAIVLIVIASFIAPMGVQFNARMLEAGDQILNRTRVDIEHIQDAEIRGAINDSITSAQDAGVNNIDVLSGMFKYSWIIVLGASVVALFLYTRRTVEYGGGGFV